MVDYMMKLFVSALKVKMYSVFMKSFSVNCELAAGSVSDGKSSMYRMAV